MAELSRATDVPIPTIKYYLREGLLPAGEAVAANQAEYAEDHARRLLLIRVLTDVGGLRLLSVRRVLDALDDERLSVHELLGSAHRALAPAFDTEEPPADLLEARREVDRFLAQLDWQVGSDAPARWMLSEALVTLRRLGRKVDATVFERYARVAERLAAHEVKQVYGRSRVDAVEGLVIGSVVFERALVALRYLAQEHHSARRG